MSIVQSAVAARTARADVAVAAGVVLLFGGRLALGTDGSGVGPATLAIILGSTALCAAALAWRTPPLSGAVHALVAACAFLTLALDPTTGWDNRNVAYLLPGTVLAAIALSRAAPHREGAQRRAESRPGSNATRTMTTLIAVLILVAILVFVVATVVAGLAQREGMAAAATAPAWQRHAPLPEPRTEVAAGVARGEIVAVGGFTAGGGNSARVDAYSITRNSWRRLPDLPVAVDHAAAASANGNVYVVGGYGADRNPLKAVLVLGADETWRRLPELPDARAAAAAAIAGGKLYVLGGVDGRRGLAQVAFALDLKTRRWARIPGPSGREHLAAAAAGTRVYALGGRSAGIDTNTARFEVYDARARRWARLANVPQARGGTGAAFVNGRIVSVGGERPEGTIASVYAYELQAKRWRRLADLPSPRHGLGVVSAAGRIYAVAGGPQPGLTVSGALESIRP